MGIDIDCPKAIIPTFLNNVFFPFVAKDISGADLTLFLAAKNETKAVILNLPKTTLAFPWSMREPFVKFWDEDLLQVFICLGNT